MTEVNANAKRQVNDKDFGGPQWATPGDVVTPDRLAEIKEILDDLSFESRVLFGVPNGKAPSGVIHTWTLGKEAKPSEQFTLTFNDETLAHCYKKVMGILDEIHIEIPLSVFYVKFTGKLTTRQRKHAAKWRKRF